jgi:hypothetical protein
MAFTPEQQAEIDAEVLRLVGASELAAKGAIDAMNLQQANSLALQVSNQQAQKELQESQNAHALDIQTKQAKLAAIQLAQNTLIANRNNQPVDAREVTADDIAAYAATLMNYINS